MSSTFFLTFCIILIAELMVSLSRLPGNMDCLKVDNTGSVVNYQLSITFGNESTVEVIQWHLMTKSGKYKYWIEGCSPSLKNKFCGNWETNVATELKVNQIKG